MAVRISYNARDYGAAFPTAYARLEHFEWQARQNLIATIGIYSDSNAASNGCRRIGLEQVAIELPATPVKLPDFIYDRLKADPRFNGAVDV